MDSLEKGIFHANTEAEAKAQILEMVNNVARANGVQTRGLDESHSKPISNDYGEMTVSVSFASDIVQLVNLLAGLAGQDQILATNGIRISGGTDKKKILQVRLSVSGPGAQKASGRREERSSGVLNRKLLLLDVVLLVVVVYAAMQFRDLYRDSKAREAAQNRVRVAPVPAPPMRRRCAPPSPVLATAYAPIAQKLLLAKDRNPDVPIDVPPPPPPPPMPPLPGISRDDELRRRRGHHRHSEPGQQ